MATEFKEPEEIENNGGGNPFDKPVNEKPYTRPNITVNPGDLQGDIPEPSFTPPPINLNAVPGGTPNQPSASAPPPPKKEPPKPLNPDMEGMAKRDSSKAASHVANMIMGGYEWLNQFASKGMVFPESKLNKLARTGEIDFSIQIPYDYASSQTMSLGEFVQEYNSQNKNAFEVSEKFKQEVTPVLKRVLEKRGVGMTDEQYLVYLFGKDISVKAVMFASARSQMSQMLKMFKEMTVEKNGGGDFEQEYAQEQQPKSPEPEPAGDGMAYKENPEDNLEVIASSISQPEYFEEGEQERRPSVQETVDAQLQNKTVEQLRQEAIERSRASTGVRKRGAGK